MAVDVLSLLSRVEAYRAINDTVSGDAVSADRDAEVIDIWLTAVSRRIDDLCGPVVVRTVTGETHDGGTHAIELRHYPVFSVTSVAEWDDTVQTTLTAETNAVKPDDGFLLDGGQYDRTVRRRSGNADVLFPAGRRNVVVDYEAGRFVDTASVDALFKMVAAAAMSRLWRREGGAWGNPDNPFTEGTSPGFFKVIDPMVREFLADEMRVPAVA